MRARVKRNGHRSTRARPGPVNDVRPARAGSKAAHARAPKTALRTNSKPHAAEPSMLIEALVAVQERAHMARQGLVTLPKRGVRILKRYPGRIALAALTLAAAVAKLLRRR